MSKKDFEMIARVLRETVVIDHAGRKYKSRADIAAYANAFADELAAANPRFDRARFLDACGVIAEDQR